MPPTQRRCWRRPRWTDCSSAAPVSTRFSGPRSARRRWPRSLDPPRKSRHIWGLPLYPPTPVGLGMYTFLLVLLIIDSIVLVSAILLQSGKGDGLSASFGGVSSSSDSLLGTRQAG